VHHAQQLVVNNLVLGIGAAVTQTHVVKAYGPLSGAHHAGDVPSRLAVEHHLDEAHQPAGLAQPPALDGSQDDEKRVVRGILGICARRAASRKASRRSLTDDAVEILFSRAGAGLDAVYQTHACVGQHRTFSFP
jgi:hypothetical protein